MTLSFETYLWTLSLLNTLELTVFAETVVLRHNNVTDRKDS